MLAPAATVLVLALIVEFWITTVAWPSRFSPPPPTLLPAGPMAWLSVIVSLISVSAGAEDEKQHSSAIPPPQSAVLPSIVDWVIVTGAPSSSAIPPPSAAEVLPSIVDRSTSIDP